MYLQGNLQTMFDALYNLGVIDPVLKMDWTEALDELDGVTDEFAEIVGIANSYQYDIDVLMTELSQYDEKILSFLAMEVAKEFADYHSREALH